MKKHEISIAFIVVALIILLVAALSGCHTEHAHHSPYPPTLNATGNCHWMNTKVKQRHHIKVNGKWKWVTVKVTQSKLVCH